MSDTYVIAVDSGGTFTDAVAIASDGSIARAKAPSTPSDFSQGVVDAVRLVSEGLGVELRELLGRTIAFAHGTTVATNTLLTRTGSKTGLLTTKGHEDAVVIGRTYQKAAGLNESELADVANLDKALSIVPRTLIEGVPERIDARGQVISPLDLDAVRAALERLLTEDVEAVGVCLLWSFLNPAHEAAILELVEREHPEIVVCASSAIAPVIGEYERTTSTMINAYVARRTSTYLTALSERLAEHGFASTPMVMQSSGGVLSIERAKALPVRLLTSGPAGGVIGAQVLGRLLGYPNVITTDVGGTSFDVGLVVEGEAQFATTAIFDRYELALPVIDVATIGAGGGSIAWIEADTGVLQVGPRSAGAEPGPACYGLGGTEATVTDADLVLGRIDPGFFLGGRRPLEAGPAHSAVAALAERLGFDVAETAMGIIDIADAHMADLVRKVTVERGFDPREFVLFAFGGAGPMHACAYGPAAGCKTIVVPSAASEFSAFGIGGSDVMVVEERSQPMQAPFDPDVLDGIYAQLEARARRDLLANGIDEERTYVHRFARLRYRGQVNEIDAPVPSGRLDEAEVERALTSFERIYEQRYGKGTAYRHAGIQAITFRVHAFGRLHEPDLRPRDEAGVDPADAHKGERLVYFRSAGGFVATPIYAYERLTAGNIVAGPAVIEAVDTTVVVHPGQEARVDGFLDLVITYSTVAP